MRKCTSFPSLVVLKHIHMFPFLLLPLLSLPLPLTLPQIFFLSNPPTFFFQPQNMKNVLSAPDGWCDPVECFFFLFFSKVLQSCYWLSSRHTVGRIQFGVLECVTAISTRPELSWWSCVQTEEAAASPHRTGWNTHTTGEAFSRVWASFFFSSLFFISFSLSVCFSLVFLSVLAPLGEKRSVLKHVLNITIFTFSCFKQAAEGGSVSVCVVWIFPFCVRVSVCVCAEVPAQRSALFETLNLFHAYLFYDFGGHRVYTGSATSGSDNLLGINQVHEPIDHQPLQLCYESFISFHSATFFHNSA